MSASSPPERPRAFFGRRRGKTLRPQRAARLAGNLPGLAIDLAAPGLDPGALFSFAPEAIHLEIGFGGGEHLLARASEAPLTGFIGCEPFINGLAKLVDGIATRDLRNLRLHDDDARPLIDRLPPASLDRIYLLYPDPWPKRRQRKRRFVSREALAAIARVLKPGAELRFATDIDDYAGWTLALAAREPRLRWTAERADDWRQPWPGWESTRYERKAQREGRRSSYLTFRRVADEAPASPAVGLVE